MRNSFIANSALLFGLAIPAAAQQSSTASAYDQAVNDWARGAYPSAMQKLVAVLSASDGDLYLERTALLTGELFRTTEITTDGRNVRWSPSGNFASYEVGSVRAAMTRILEMKVAPKQLGEVKG